MAYIGREPLGGEVIIMDSIESQFNGVLTTFNLTRTVSGVTTAFYPVGSQQLLVSLGGVIQRPDPTGNTGFRISFNTIIFAVAPSASTSCFIISYGNLIDIGAPANNTVTTDKLVDGSVTPAKLSAGGPSWNTSGTLGIVNPNYYSGSYPWYINQNSTNGYLAINYYGNTNNFVIRDNGNVGIGTTTVDYKLDVNGSAQIRVGESLYFQNAAANGRASIQCAGAGTNTDLTINTAGSERCRIDSSGNVGIGTTSPNLIGVNANSRCLSIVGDGTTTNARGTLELRNPIADAAGITLGSIYFNGGAAAINYAEIRAVSSGTGGANGFGNELRFATKDDNGSHYTKMVLTSTGNLGIGTTNPTYKLDIDGVARASIFVSTSYSVFGSIVVNEPGVNYYSWNNRIGGGLAVVGTTYLDGNVGIGTTNPYSKLNILLNGVVANTSSLVNVSSWANNTLQLHNNTGGTTGSEVLLLGCQAGGNGQLASGFGFGRENSGDWGTYISFKTHSTSTAVIDELYERMRISANGNVGIGTTNPSSKLDVNGSVSANDSYRLDDSDTAAVIQIQSDIDGNYTGWKERNVASGSMSQTSIDSKTPIINDFTYPNSSNGMLIWSTSKIGFAAGSESPQFGTGVQMLYDASGLALSGYRAFDRTSSVSSSTANIKLFSQNGNATFAGNVGIGTTNPQYKLDVTSQLGCTYSGALRHLVNIDSDGGKSYWYNGTPTNTAYILGDSGNAYFAGNVTIGPVGPTTPLSVRRYSNTSYGNVSANFSDNVTGTLYISHTSGTQGLISDGKLSFGSGPSGFVRMLIDSSGNVGIGTVSPAENLHIHSGLAVIRLSGSAENQTPFNIRQGIVGTSNGGFSIYDVNNSATRFAINSSGNIGIGVDPAYKLHISGNASFSGSQSSTPAYIYANGGGDDSSLFIKAGSTAGVWSQIEVTGNWNGSANTGGKVAFYAGGTERQSMNAIGAIIKNQATREYNYSGYVANNQVITIDVPVVDDNGAGCGHKIWANHTHYNWSGYGALLECWVSSRGTTIVEQYNTHNITSGNGGAWTVTKPNATTLRISKSAGTYPGGGYYWVRIITNHF